MQAALRLFLPVVGLWLLVGSQSGRAQDVPITDSGGRLMPEQAAYDVTFYDLDLTIDPEARRIDGALVAHVTFVHPAHWLVLDLDTTMTVERVEQVGPARVLAFERRGGKLWCALGRTFQPGETLAVRIAYGGRPREAVYPPWVGGFSWATTRDGAPWIATSVQGEGADLWWPCKDHPSDEPDSMALHITVPEELTVASNGRLRAVTPTADGQRTFHWFVSTPINNYAVALNIAPYRTLEATYRSITGEEIPVTFWVLPEAYDQAGRQFPQFLEHLAFYEQYLGPYPFRADKYGVAHTPFYGMEHQTIIAYGSDFSNDDYGYDWLHHHELGHEWWGNLVTAADWSDFWIHEGLCTYMQALYAGELFGREGYLRDLLHYRPLLVNKKPVAPRGTWSTDQIQHIDPSEPTDNDIYYKGAWVLHALRYLIGDEAFFATLRRMAYPTEERAQWTDGRQNRFVDTEDFVSTAEAASGMELDWFFEVYLRQPQLPELVVTRTAEGVSLRWHTPDDLPFPMPVEVQVGDAVQRIPVPADGALVSAPEGADVRVDPNQWLLKEEAR